MLGLKTGDKKNNGHKDNEKDEHEEEKRAEAVDREVESMPVVKVIARCAVLIVPVPVLSPESIAPDDTGRKRKTVTLTGDLVPSQSVR